VRAGKKQTARPSRRCQIDDILIGSSSAGRLVDVSGGEKVEGGSF
jgi:hypothetical protein